MSCPFAYHYDRKTYWIQNKKQVMTVTINDIKIQNWLHCTAQGTALGLNFQLWVIATETLVWHGGEDERQIFSLPVAPRDMRLLFLCAAFTNPAATPDRGPDVFLNKLFPLIINDNLKVSKEKCQLTQFLSKYYFHLRCWLQVRWSFHMLLQNLHLGQYWPENNINCKVYHSIIEKES